MLLALSEALTELGVPVTVVAPSNPDGVVGAARGRGLDTVALKASTRLEYLSALRKWDREERQGVLWCNGLLPAVATTGHQNRIVHLHQRPQGKQRILASIARWRCITTLVPSENMVRVVRGASAFLNWTADMNATSLSSRNFADVKAPYRVGFLGRPSTGKGVDVLARAMKILDHATPGHYELLIAGESRFVNDGSRSKVERALQGLGGMVTRTGWIEAEGFLARIDCLVCPSVFPESFGLVAAESMSAKVPVVVSDAGALPEVVGPDHPWLAVAGDAEDLARVIRLAAKGDSEAVEAAYQRWDSLFSPRAGIRRVDRLLSDLGIITSSGRGSDHE